MRKPIADPIERRLVASRGDWEPEDYSIRLGIPDSRIAIASDVHIPYHDEKLLARFLHRCEEYSIESIVWLGDLLDLPTFSSWGRTDYTTLFPRELGMARTVLEMASEIVGVQYWSSGNHEYRLFRKNEAQFGMEHLARLVGVQPLLEDARLIVSDNPSLDAGYNQRTGKWDWMLTHPAKYGKQPLVFPGQLASLYQQHVLSAHAHHWAMGTDPTGKYTVIETGGLFQPNYHEYVNYRVTGHRRWAQGFWFLVDGRPIGFRGDD